MDSNIQSFYDTAELLKTLGHPVRLCIVNGLLNKESCNVSYMQQCLSLPQSTVSQHLAKLRAAGIIEAERSGLEVRYRIKDERVKRIVQALTAAEE
ncbi:ArsR/SmtB family transcription factor [Paenibacillus xylaniclasticus]|uniref:ArsR/SmtB family transcription factor n=1 Tax=Paenibacillus xylaniclasticus TaxID=588083 RepID=UPI000FD87D08|nr:MULTISPECIES: metalloregulator ArsR/SmtB family transcription factor [Paenibacillus]GFN29941.1 transcriptional regulator [Paenibacillus curdlanolyticus]